MPAKPITGKTICILPRLGGLGGPSSFQAKLVTGLQQRGIGVTHNPAQVDCTAILLVGGISNLPLLWLAHRRGLRIVQRLNGMNWLHRKRHSSLAYFLRCEWNNWILTSIRSSLADQIIYQSNFAEKWWQTVKGTSPAASQVVYNGVDLASYQPEGRGEPPAGRVRLLMVEGHVGGGYEQGLSSAVRLAQALNLQLNQPVQLVVAGNVPERTRNHWRSQSGGLVHWAGVLPRDEIPPLARSSHLLFSADLNAACPNSVIEALSCGLPVLAFATGSLPELIDEDAGRVVPYGSNYWNLEEPDINGLASAGLELLANLPHFRLAARRRAEKLFGLETMVDKYLAALLPSDAS